MKFKELFGKKKNKNSPNNVILKAQVNIETKANEIFATTKVTQKLFNNTQNPIELEININKYLDNFIFSSFHAKIGNSLVANSKVIKEEKAEEKYTDSISSGNAAIYTTIDQYDKNKIIVHIGNIPPNEELTFISKFIKSIESSNNCYEYELFRNLPIMKGNLGSEYDNENVKGSLEIKTKNKITKIDKKNLSKKLVIKQEKNEDNGKLFFLEYEYKGYSSPYIPSSKIYFNLESNMDLTLFSQNCLKNKEEFSYLLNFKLTENNNKKENQEDIKLNPALFIFLLDQSGSMAGSPIKVASKALILFLQSLPAGSYYQIIGFGSDYKLYDKNPKEYNQKNILESIKLVESLKGDMGGTDIYKPLKHIYNSSQNYNKILLPRNIFLLTDGEIKNKNDTLNLIEKNSNEYSVYSFGIGNDFDEDLIKNAGIVGKGDYSFCKKIDGLNQVIVSTLNNICVSYINEFKINSSLDKFILYKTNETAPVIKQNKIYRFGYITKQKLDLKQFDFTVEYKLNEKKFKKNYVITPNELPDGDELSKLLIYEYISKANLSDEEKIKLALKYQIFIEGTSLFAEIELSEKNTKELIQHKEVIREEKVYSNRDNKEDILDKRIKKNELRLQNMEDRVQIIENEMMDKLKNGDKAGAKRLAIKKVKLIENMKQIEGNIVMMEEQKMMLDNTSAMKDVMSTIKAGNEAIKCPSKGFSIEEFEENNEDMENMKEEDLNQFFKEYGDEDDDKAAEVLEELAEKMENEKTGAKEQKNLEEKNEEDLLMDFLAIDGEDKLKQTEEKKEERKEEKKEEKKEIKEKKEEIKNKNENNEEEKDLNLDLKKKEDIMKIINCQNFVEGFWDINNKTKIIKKKYENEFKLLKELKDKKIDDIVAITIIIIYFINKEHKELLDELIMILKKAKLYIQKKIGDSYENIIKKAGIK